MNDELMHISHSKIAEYPPNPQKFPNFYHCKEQIFILNPGDMLYIPPKWFHWVFSYGNENRENLAISYSIFNPKNKDVFNDFYFGKPFVFNLNDKFNNFSLNKLNQEYIQKVFLSRSNTIVPVQKLNNKTISKKMSIKDIIELHNKQTHNISISQEPYIKLGNEIPRVIQDSFPKDEINSFLWFNLLKNDNTYIETGLHYDITHNILIQLKGTKVVRLFAPHNAKNLYLQPTYNIKTTV